MQKLYPNYYIFYLSHTQAKICAYDGTCRSVPYFKGSNEKYKQCWVWASITQHIGKDNKKFDYIMEDVIICQKSVKPNQNVYKSDINFVLDEFRKSNWLIENFSRSILRRQAPSTKL